ncbi:MAG: TolC family protein [Holosporales bacterium]|jgi:outer membrane protein|nr:TolC family protein [Holosporales bacterium]
MYAKSLLLLGCLGLTLAADASQVKKQDINHKEVSSDSARDSKQPQSAQSQKNLLFAAMESALKNNKETLAMEKDLMADHEEHVIAMSRFRPDVSANTKYQASGSKAWSSLKNFKAKPSRSNSRLKTYGVEVKQNLFRGGADAAGLKEADLRIGAKQYQYEEKKQEVLDKTATYYYAIVAKAEEIENLKVLYNSRKESIDVAEKMFEAGAAKELDVLQAKAAAAETEAKLTKAKSEYIAYCSEFEELTGYKMPFTPTGFVMLFNESISENQAIDIALKRNPKIIRYAETLSAAKAAIKKVNTEFTPSVDASYSFNQAYDSSTKKGNRVGDKKFNSKEHSFTIGLTLPIYDGGQERAKKRQYIDLAERAAVEKEKETENIKTQIHSEYAALRAAKQNIDSAQEAVAMRERALQDTQKEYKVGAKIMDDVLKAQGELCEAKSLVTQAKKEYFTAQGKLKTLIGEMNPQRLKIADSSFDYKADFKKTSKKF